MKPRVLITGINGKIGQAIVAAKHDDWDIVGMDVAVSEVSIFPFPVFAADISDWDAVDRVFDEIGKVEYVIHLAAIASSRASWDEVLRHNIIGTRHVYERAKNAGVRRIVFASSWHVVGGYHLHGGESPAITVVDSVRPDGDYATSKAFGEALARQYYELHGVESICLRIGNVEANDQPRDTHAERIWLSHRDLIQLVELSVSSDIPFGIYFAISANAGRFLDLSNAERDLGYRPQDDAGRLTTD
jgi:nucleoside-diphosphate-sugar epimerase